jgi:uncharacterized protein (TIGR02284 family)
MSADDLKLVKTLSSLIRINNAAAQGFNIAAENVDNRGLKVMFKSHGAERAEFSEELSEYGKAYGGQPTDRTSIAAAAHRGWINIKAAMTIGEESTERVVLSEILRGEAVAARRYREALGSTLPDELRNVLTRHLQRIEEVQQQTLDLRGQDNVQLVLRLFDSTEILAEARDELESAGFKPEQMRSIPLEQIAIAQPDASRDRTTAESALAGALVGGAVGAGLGLVAGLSTLIAPGSFVSGLWIVGGTFVSALVLGTLAGLAFGALLGTIIGFGVRQADTYRYAASLERGSVLLFVETTPTRAAEANTIMQAVNARRWQSPQAAAS